MSIALNEIHRLFDLYIKLNKLSSYKVTVNDPSKHKEYIEETNYKISYLIKESSELKEVIKKLPNPYYKSEIAKTIQSIHIELNLNGSNPTEFNVNINIDTDNHTFKTKSGKLFESEISKYHQYNEQYVFSTNTLSEKKIASKTGMLNSYKSILFVFLEKLQNESSELYFDYYEKTNILDDSLDVDDYEADLYAMVIDYNEDYTQINKLYDGQLSKLLFKTYFNVTIPTLKQAMYQTYLLFNIDTEKIKVLISYILKYQPDNISIMNLFSSNIPNNVITSKYMPDLKLEKILF